MKASIIHSLKRLLWFSMVRSWLRLKLRSTSFRTATQMRTTTLRSRMRNWNTVFHLHWWSQNTLWQFFKSTTKVGASTVLDIGGRKVRGRQVTKVSWLMTSGIVHTKTVWYFCMFSCIECVMKCEAEFIFNFIVDFMFAIPKIVFVVSLGSGGYRECGAQWLCLPQKISDSNPHAGQPRLLPELV